MSMQPTPAAHAQRPLAAVDTNGSLRTADVGEVLIACGIVAGVSFVVGLARIEEITLTDVVVRVWDGTSLILLCTYFTTTPFLNWTHQGTSATGIVEIGVDWTVPIDDLRRELGRTLARSSSWDGEKGELHVEDASGPVVTLIAEVSAADGDSLTPLRRDVREGLVDYIQREHVDAVPHAREESTTRLVALRHGLGELDDYEAYVRDVFAPTLRDVAQHFPVMVGEWSLDTTSPAPHTLPLAERQRYFHTMADVQLQAWEPAIAWTYWSYKMTIGTPASDVWDFGKAIDLGLLPDGALR